MAAWISVTSIVSWLRLMDSFRFHLRLPFTCHRVAHVRPQCCSDTSPVVTQRSKRPQTRSPFGGRSGSGAAAGGAPALTVPSRYPHGTLTAPWHRPRPCGEGGRGGRGGGQLWRPCSKGERCFTRLEVNVVGGSSVVGGQDSSEKAGQHRQ